MAAAEPQIGIQPGQEAQQAPPAALPATSTETIAKTEHERELDRYRNQVGAEKKKSEELAAELAAIKEAGKSEAEKIAAKAAELDALLPRVKSLEKALKAQVEAIRGQLSEPLAALIPEGPVELQFAHAEKLLAAQAQIVPAPAAGQAPRTTLPAADGGNRMPQGGDDKRTYEEAAEMFPTLSRLQPRKGI